MSTRYVQGFTGPVTTTTPGWGNILPFATPIGYDKTRDALVYEDENGVIKVVTGNQTPSITTAAAVTVTTADANRSFIGTLDSGTQTFTLPLASTMPGAKVRFECGHADGEILINPNAADQISIKGLVDHSTSVKPAAGTGVKNTAATNVLGDHVTLESDGVLTWRECAGAGIWASQ